MAASALRIAFFLADDMGQWAAQPYGNTEIITPTLSKLAADGTTFTNAVCNTPVCSASRTSLLTGRMPSQHGVHDWLSNGNGCGQRVVNFSAAETFYTDRLAESGFDQIGLSGKFHLGNSEQALHGYNWWQFVHQSGGGSYIEPPIVANGSCVTLKGYVTDMIADDAVRFVHTHGKAPKWYLGVHFTAPHAPYYGKDGKAASMHPPSVVALYENTSFDSVPNLPFDAQNYTDNGFGRCFTPDGRRECLKGYFAAVTAMDSAIQRVLDALTAEEVLDDTLVVFTSDHGFNTGHHGLWGKGNGAWPLNMVETSLKVPLIFRWPAGGVAKGATIDARVMHVDMAPTLLALAGVKDGLPRPAGASYADLLRGASPPPAVPTPTLHEFGGTRAVHAKLASARYVTYKLVNRRDGRDELYDLDADPLEADDLLARGVNPTGVADALRRVLMGGFDFLRDPFRSGWELPVTGKGQNDVAVYGMSVPVVPFQPLYH